MTSVRDRISKATGFYFKKTLISESFVRLAKGGQLDLKMLIKILGEICDYLEEAEAKKK